jgi:hypothetical protein
MDWTLAATLFKILPLMVTELSGLVPNAKIAVTVLKLMHSFAGLYNDDKKKVGLASIINTANFPCSYLDWWFCEIYGGLAYGI